MRKSITVEYRLDNLTDLEAFLRDLREAVEPAWKEARATLLCRLVLHVVDRGDLVRDNRPGGFTATAIEFWDKFGAAPDRQGLEVLISRDSKSKNYSLWMFNSQYIHRETLRGLPEVNRSDYWANLEAEEVATAEKWAALRSAWDRAITEASEQDETALYWGLPSDFLVGDLFENSDREKTVNHALTEKERARDLARVAYEVYLRETSGDRGASPAVKDSDLAVLAEIIRPALASATAQLIFEGEGAHGFSDIREDIRRACSGILIRSVHNNA